jgi:choline dehydrogenase-like flavoprotein
VDLALVGPRIPEPAMIVDAETLAEDWFRQRQFDVCVVGAGPAGITLATRLGRRGVSVGLFEGGALEATQDSQELYRGTTEGQPYYPLDGTRLRYFGGTSNHWGGWTRPLDVHDFEARRDHDLSGWPFGKEELDRYAAEADRILDLTPDLRPPELFPAQEANVVPRLFRFSRPATRFGEKYRLELEKSERVHVFLNANLVDLSVDDGRRSVSEALFRSYHREMPFAVRARYFVLCLGGIENPRALLNANRQIAEGLGNANDMVGRYFLEHPHAPVGRVVVRRPLTFMVVYSPTPEFMRDGRILNFGLRIGDFDQWNAGEFSGQLAPHPLCDVPFETMLAAEMRGEPPPCPAHAGDVFVACEQSLDPSNRVSLTGERDRFGLQRVKLDWHVSDMDLRTLKTAALEVGELLAERDVGRMKVVDWLLNEEAPTGDQLWGGNHHMGTTRMSADPKHGVVDRNAKLHALENLYMGGSSIFPTSGHANPTYTIVQLALRQADHLAARLGQP